MMNARAVGVAVIFVSSLSAYCDMHCMILRHSEKFVIGAAISNIYGLCLSLDCKKTVTLFFQLCQHCVCDQFVCDESRFVTSSFVI